MIVKTFEIEKINLDKTRLFLFYGENEAEYGNAIEDTESATRNWAYFTGDDLSRTFLGGVSIQRLQADFDVKPVDLELYYPIDPQVAKDKNIEVHYLGYYIPWHPQGAYYYAVENGGFQASPERTPACTAAPRATTSSGLTPRCGSLPNRFLTSS